MIHFIRMQSNQAQQLARRELREAERNTEKNGKQDLALGGQNHTSAMV